MLWVARMVSHVSTLWKGTFLFKKKYIKCGAQEEEGLLEGAVDAGELERR